MNDKDLDSDLIKTINSESASEIEKYQIMYICDESVFMMFDLERGGFISKSGDNVHSIDDLWKFKYKRVLVESYVVDSIETIISNFYIKVWYNDNIILNFETYGKERKFKLLNIEGFHAGMFLEVLDNYRKSKFKPEENNEKVV